MRSTSNIINLIPTQHTAMIPHRSSIFYPLNFPPVLAKLGSLLLLGFASVATLDAAMITLGAAKDATIFQNNVNNSNGAGPGIFAGTNSTLSPRRGLISFDLSSIPTGSIITNVQFTLTLGQVAGSGGGGGANGFDKTIRLFKLASDWGEGTTGGTAPAIGGTGQGYAAATGDATWTAPFHSGTAWNNAGGDFDATASATQTILTGATVGSAHTWGSTARLVADVQGWVDTPTTNFGWLLKNDNETGSQTFISFYTSEWSDRANPPFTASPDPVLEAQYAAQEPSLQVTFTPVPEPTSIVLLAAAFCFLLATRIGFPRQKSCK